MTRVVFDTNTVISALLFGGALSWLVRHWQSRVSVSLISRDPQDRMFLALAEAGRADVLVSGDDDLLALRGQVRFRIETPEQFRTRFV